jgi:type IV secretion system protein VirB1
VVQVESGFEPLAIGVNGAPRIRVKPTSVDEAVAKAAALIEAGRSVDLGLAQINSKNLSWLGLSLADVFEPCENLKAAARILQDGYGRSNAAQVGEQAALKTALSYYNTGHPARGFRNGYVARVASAAEQIVPAIGGAGVAILSEKSRSAPPDSPPSWDVFGEVKRARSIFVTTVSTATSGGFQ